MTPDLTLALVQMRVAPGDKAANLRHAAELVAQAAGQGAQVAVLPEVMTLGWTYPAAAVLADEIPDGETCRLLRALARQHGIYLCAGLAERAGGQCYNAAVLVGPDGALLLHHRKINELDIGHACYALGDRLGVARTPLGCFGLMICADGFAPGQVLGRSLALMGAQVILSPCAWAVSLDYDQERTPYGQLWRDNYGPVARDYGIWIAGVSNVGPIPAGPWAGRKCIGNSLLIGPDGHPAVTGPYGEAAEAILIHRLALPDRSRPGAGPRFG